MSAVSGDLFGFKGEKMIKSVFFLMHLLFCVQAIAADDSNSNDDESESVSSPPILLPAPLPPKDTGIGVVSY